MIVAIWIIAIVEIVRILQNFMQLMIYAVQAKSDIEQRTKVYEHFKDALREETARIFAKKMVDEFEERHKNDNSEEVNE